MSKYFNDSPIEKPEDDQYGVAAFSSALATSLLEMAMADLQFQQDS